MRLDQLLKANQCGSRNAIKKLLKSRQVRVNGVVTTQANLIVDANVQEIRVSGKKLEDNSLVYYLLNKPQGVVTACSDANHPTVLDLISTEDFRPGLYPVGRLDRDTEGLVLMTNNGPLGYRLLHPKHHVLKTYEVVVNGFLGDDAIDFFEQGVRFLDGTQCQPALIEIFHASENASHAKVTLSEGKFHQVKKMFLAYGVKVISLKRTQFGPLNLSDLALGTYRPLHKAELIHLFADL